MRGRTAGASRRVWGRIAEEAAGALPATSCSRSAALCVQGTEGHAGRRAATEGEPDLKYRHVSTAETPPPWDGLRGIQRAEMPQTHSSQRNCDYRSCGGERGRRADDARRSASRSVMARPQPCAGGGAGTRPAAPLCRRRAGPAPRCPQSWDRRARRDGQHRHLPQPGPPTLPTQFIQQL